MNWSRDFMIMPELSSVRLRTEIGGLQCRRAHSARLHRLCINALWFDLAKKRGAVVSPRFAVLLLTVSLVLLWSPLTLAAVQVSFSLESPAGGPFPSDLFTVADPSHNTGLRVNLPKPNCTVRPSDCADLDVINTLDGFNVQPRLSIPFSGPIDVNTVTSETVFLVSLGSTLPGDDPGGPLGTLTVSQVGGDSITFAAGGRGIDQNGDGIIATGEGRNAAPPQQIIANRDGLRQTVVDLIQLVRVIEVGMDVDGDGASDLDPSRIYYFGTSLGGIYGTIFLAVEPNAQAGVLNVPGGPWIELLRLNPFARPFLGTALASRVPSLINVGGTTFNENMPQGPATSH